MLGFRCSSRSSVSCRGRAERCDDLDVRGLWWLVLAGCRWNFGQSDADAPPADDVGADTPVCASAVHDEDNDGIDDACDPCPHLFGSAGDADRDGVGDACDPQPDLARQRIAFFDSFTAARGEWVLSNLTLAQDMLHATSMSPATSYGSLMLPTSDVRIIAKGTVRAAYVPTPHGIALSFGFNAGGANYHYVQFYDIGGANGAIDIAKAEGGSYPSLTSTTYAGTLPLGSWQMDVDVSVSMQHIRFVPELGSTSRATLDANTTMPTMLTTGPGLGLLIRNADVTVDCLIVIATQ